MSRGLRNRVGAGRAPPAGATARGRLLTTHHSLLTSGQDGLDVDALSFDLALGRPGGRTGGAVEIVVDVQLGVARLQVLLVGACGAPAGRMRGEAVGAALVVGAPLLVWESRAHLSCPPVGWLWPLDRTA